MIPNKLHYVWVGGKPIPAENQRYIDQWEKLMPGWEIVRWDETNFDINQSDYCRQAYEAGKWAFVSDYIRLKVLYEHGGIYLDTDIDMIKPLDRFASDKVFFCLEPGPLLQACVFGCQAYNPVMGAIVSYYDKQQYIIDGKPDNTVIGTHILRVFRSLYPGIEMKEEIIEPDNGVLIYPSRFFCPDLATLRITEDSYTVHRPMGSWLSPAGRLKMKTYVLITRIKPLNWLYRKMKR